jgi:hypothetical protein
VFNAGIYVGRDGEVYTIWENMENIFEVNLVRE